MKQRFFKTGLTLILAMLMVCISACTVGNSGTPTDTTEECSSTTSSETTPETTDGSPESPTDPAKNAVTILYTNDIHAYLNNDATSEKSLSYAEIAQMKKDLGEYVLLVDAGDHVQGAVYGAMDQGQSVLEIMDTMYDLATLGNHEFDYGIARTLSLTSNAKYPYISCNFVHKDSGKPVLEPHVMKTVGHVKIGFVGITTPETLTSTAPAYFQNEAGECIYDFLDDERLYAAVQASIDALKADGADYIIALGHVGTDPFSHTTSRDIIAHVKGLSAFIDGHSHTEIANEQVKGKDNKDVLLTQTGYYFGGVGKMTIDEDGIKTEIVKEYATKDETVLAAKNAWVQAVDDMLGEKIATLGFKLTTTDADGNRLVRVDGTNLGEFVADSSYYYVNFVAGIDCDVAIINGGGLRADIGPGQVSYKDLKSANPFGNMICAVELTGQQILDMLEWGARATTGCVGEYEEGSFLHTAGLTYTVDTSFSSTVQKDDQDIWTGSPTGEYRVKDVKIYNKEAKAYVDLDLTKTYIVAGANYTLTSRGGGFNMVNGQTVKDYIVEDYMALAAYAIAFDDVDNDDLSDITSANSPLRVYENYTINYESPDGTNRVNVEKQMS